MLLAYLRGALPAEQAYGLRSIIAEDVILEGMAAQLAVDVADVNMQLDAAMLPVLNIKGVRATMKSIGARALRCSELRLMDIYRLEKKAQDAATRESEKNTLSLYQLYQVAEKQGIFDALRAQDPVTTDD